MLASSCLMKRSKQRNCRAAVLKVGTKIHKKGHQPSLLTEKGTAFSAQGPEVRQCR